MTKSQKITLAASRISFGLYLLYAGVTKTMDPTWSAGNFLNNASTFSGFYSSLAQPDLLPIVNFLNEWGLTLIGVSLIFGVLTRWSASLGALLMLLYYFPGLSSPYISEESFFIDSHIIYATGLAILATFDSGKVYGLEKKVRRTLRGGKGKKGD